MFSGKFDGLAYAEAVDAVAADLAAKGLGEKKITFRLRDWGVSRQRYWGTPIPIIHCDACGAVPVPESDLPVVLPEDCVPDGGGNPLNKRPDSSRRRVPEVRQAGRRETDTLDTFVDSSWYYMRYTSPGADRWSTRATTTGCRWTNTSAASARDPAFALRSLLDQGHARPGAGEIDDPSPGCSRRACCSTHIYYRRNAKGGKDHFPPDSVAYDRCAGHIDGGRLADGSIVSYGGVGKMGKTEQNGVEPQDLIDKYGADTARLYVMFAGSPDDSAIWSDTGVEGAHRFLKRLWAFSQARADAVRGASGRIDWSTADATVKAARRELHVTLKQANYDYDRIQYNTVVSAGMKMLNTLEAVPVDKRGGEALQREGLAMLLRTLYPVVPHVTWALWQELGLAAEFGDLLDAAWPEVDASALVQDEIELMLQVNGKLRGKLRVPVAARQCGHRGRARARAPKWPGMPMARR